MSDKPTDGLPPPQLYWAILTIILGITLAVLDSAIANVALPTIASDLHARPAASIWIVNAYQLAITISLLPLASLGDIVGYRRIYRVGLAVFTFASLACALSDSLVTLTVARVLQGFGAAGIMSVNTALLRVIYPQRMLGRGVGINALVVAVGAAAGPTVAAGILAVAHWQWLFAVNVPIGLVAFLIAMRALPKSQRSPHAFDWQSALYNALTFGLLISAIDSFGHGQRLPTVGLELLLAVAMGVLLVRRQLKLPLPLLPVDLLRIPMFALSISTSVCSFAAQMLAYVSLPFYLQDTLGRSYVATGLLMTPWPIAIVVVAPIAGRLVERHHPGTLGAIGLLLFGTGLGLLAMLPHQPSSLDIVWRMALCGVGFGLFQSPNNYAMITSAPKHRSGGASGMLGTARLVGQTTGAALVALVFNLAPVRGTTITLVVAACFALAASGVSALRMRVPRQANVAGGGPA
ncbi:MFS transporter [Pandoraea sp.]|uniref:MFS transporter n=1 Tax=Pandoraea sp. TaxID=1883445 RepID=UPI0012004F4A|nr:MFS transporter [Pandoraea sp.]TAL54363.1 MAG: MFS transporter [Pandoraea sp.]TAM17413.1 MAG: MFS transporter [Pandoraea sp.]